MLVGLGEVYHWQRGVDGNVFFLRVFPSTLVRFVEDEGWWRKPARHKWDFPFPVARFPHKALYVEGARLLEERSAPLKLGPGRVSEY